MIKALILLAAFTGALAAQCPLFDPVSNLIIQTQMGNWGIHGRVLNADLEDPKLQCLHADLSSADTDKEPVNITAHIMGTRRESGEDFHYNDFAQVPDLGRPGLWYFYRHDDSTPFEGTIIHTDYVEYSLFVICRPRANDYEIEAMFLGRSHNPMPESVITNYKSMLQDYGVDVSNYQTIVHGHMICH